MASNPPGKQKSPKFQIEKIRIGQWIRVSKYPDSLVAKCYLGEKKLIWEILDDDAPIGLQRLKKKIQIEWDDVLSIRVDPSSPDGTEILHVELSKPPTFHMETLEKPLTQTQTKWDKTDQDFTLNQASTCRRHTLHFPRGVLLENMKTLTSANKFWSDIINKPFPTLPNSLYFDDYANINNHGQTLSSSVNNHQSQGFARVQSGEGNSSMATQFYPNEGRQINSFVQSNSENVSLYQFLLPQNNEQGSRGVGFPGQHYNNRLVQAGTNQMRNTAHHLLDGRQINSFVQSNSENVSLYQFLLPQNNEQGSRGVGFPGQHYNNRLVQAGTNQMRNTLHPSLGAQATSQLSNELRSRRGDSQFGNRLVQAGTNQMRNTAHYLLDGRQINSFVQSNSENVSLNQFLVPQNNEQGSRGGGFPGQHYNNRLVQAGTRHIRNTLHPSLGAQATSQLSNELCSRRGDSQFGNRLVQAGTNQMRNTAHHLLEEGTNQQYSRGGAQSYKPLFLGSQTDCEIVYGSSNSQGSGRERVTHTWYDDGSYVGVILDP